MLLTILYYEWIEKPVASEPFFYSHQYFGYLPNVFFCTMAKPKTWLQLRTDCSFTQVVKIWQKHGHKLLEMRVQLLGDRRNCQRHSRSLGGNLIWNVTWFSLGHRLEDSFGHWDDWSSSSHRTQTVQGNTHAYKQPSSGLPTIRVGDFGVKFKILYPAE